MAPSLQSIPPELLDNIAQYCTAGAEYEQDFTLSNLRSTCRRVEHGTRKVWIERYFTTRQVRFDADKLEELRCIGDEPALAKAVNVLRVECIEDIVIWRLLPEDDTLAQIPQETLNHYEQVLALALTHLENTDEIQLVPRNGNNPARDEGMEVYILDFSHTLSVVLKAVEQCNIQLGYVRSPEILKYPQLTMGPSDGVALAESLCYSIGLSELTMSFLPNDNLAEGRANQLELSKKFTTGLSLCLYLKDLNLHFSFTRDPSPVFARMATHVYLPRLTHLELSNLCCDLHTLRGFLYKHRDTLRTCGLICLEIMDSLSTHDFTTFLFELKDGFTFAALHLSEIGAQDVMFNFRGRFCVQFAEVPVEGEWVGVEYSPSKIILLYDEVQEGLLEMIENIYLVSVDD